MAHTNAKNLHIEKFRWSNEQSFLKTLKHLDNCLFSICLTFPRATKRIKFLKILQFKIFHNRKINKFKKKVVVKKYVSILKANEISSGIKKKKIVQNFTIINTYIL